MSNITEAIRAERRERLMPGGIPRYIRIWDNTDEFPHDGITVVFTKKGIRGHDGTYFFYVSMNKHGDYYHGELHQKHQGKHLGKRIKFTDLPEACQKVVISDYEELWDL